MRWVVYGAGAIGGLVGARLHQAGHDVVLVARGEHAAVMAEHGLTVRQGERVDVVHVPVVTSPSALSLRADDVVLLTVKGQDTMGALDALAPVAVPGVALVCAQNGVDNERVALRRFADVYAMCVMCPAAHLHPGEVESFASPVPGILEVGRYPSGTDQRAEDMAAALRSATFASMARPDLLRWKYAKLLLNLGNAVEAVAGSGARRGELTRRVRAEGEAVLRAAGIAWVGAEEEAERRSVMSGRRVGDGRDGGSSTNQSLLRATGSVEVDQLNGEVVLMGRLHGVPTPANELLQRLANDLARQRRPPGSHDEASLLALLDA